MNIPEKIRINGVDYEIKEVIGLNDGSKVLYGQVTYGQTLIELNPDNQSEQYKKVTLWHEIFHVIEETNGLDFGENKEKVIDTLAFAVNQILEDNKNALFGEKQTD